MSRPTIKELLMALPNEKRIEIWKMLEEAKSDVCAYKDTLMHDKIENQYDAIMLEVQLHMEAGSLKK